MNPRNESKRVRNVFDEHYRSLVAQADRVFGFFLLFQWVVGIALALIISPLTLSGSYSETHIHVYAAIFLGGLIAGYPAYLVFTNPGATFNRMVVAVSQMLFSVLYIHLMGGRIETHFHIFGSLAFLAFYRDWRTLAIATFIVMADHFIRGAFWPESIYGVLSSTPWRAVEHGAWVLFEDVVLYISIRMSLSELWATAKSEVNLTQERNQTKMLLDIAVSANQSDWPVEAIGQAINRFCSVTGWQFGHAYFVNESRKDLLIPTRFWCSSPDRKYNQFANLTEATCLEEGQGLAGQAYRVREAIWMEDLGTNQNFPRGKAAAECGIHSALAFPIFSKGRVVAVVEFFSSEIWEKNPTILTVLHFVAHQIGQVFDRKEAKDELDQLNRFLEVKVKERTQELHQSQQQLLAQQQSMMHVSKMSALGEMAGGVAHEINTPLAVISMKVEQMEEAIGTREIDLDSFSEDLKIINKTTDRIGKIVNGLRFFAREGHKAGTQKMKAASIIDETISLCRERFLNHGVDLNVVNDDAYAHMEVECRSVEISQVLLNLLNNAFDAVQFTQKKWIQVNVSGFKGYVEISITDSGNGIPKEVEEKIMQPFFTTKPIGKGTGLGLSISKGIAEDHGGKLYLDRDCPNTRFVILLPLEQKKSADHVA